MKNEEDNSGLYEASGLKEIFEEKEKDFWEGVETDYWDKEEKKEVEEVIKKIQQTDENLVLNREEYYSKVQEITSNLSDEMSKDIFEEDFKEPEKKKDEIDPFWLS